MLIRPVILGLGNPLFQDEGIGIHMVQQLMQELNEEKVNLIDGGTDALALLGVVEDAVHLLIIDAVDGGLPAGSISRLQGEDIPLFLSNRLSPHQIGFQEVLALARIRGRLPENIMLLAVQPGCLDWGTELTPPVGEALPRLRKMVYDQINRWEIAAESSNCF